MCELALVDEALPPMRWGSASAAYRWAEETASRPDYRSPAGVIVQTMVGEIIGGGVSGWKPEDYRDLAHSILAAVASISEVYPREMYRFVYGASAEREASLGGLIGESLTPLFPKKTYSQLRRVGQVAVMKKRVRIQRGQDMGKNWYAKALGIQRPSLYDGQWPEVIASAEQSVDQVLARGRHLAREAIEKLGVL